MQVVSWYIVPGSIISYHTRVVQGSGRIQAAGDAFAIHNRKKVATNEEISGKGMQKNE
ncbi:MAG: hypothetical protein LUQ13_01600 [Methanomicrobiales archaeon]|nr:hypothetical protein [Methanomicrobiales archaeon]